jgi:hypothetical protein
MELVYCIDFSVVYHYVLLFLGGMIIIFVSVYHVRVVNMFSGYVKGTVRISIVESECPTKSALFVCLGGMGVLCIQLDKKLFLLDQYSFKQAGTITENVMAYRHAHTILIHRFAEFVCVLFFIK